MISGVSYTIFYVGDKENYPRMIFVLVSFQYELFISFLYLRFSIFVLELNLDFDFLVPYNVLWFESKNVPQRLVTLWLDGQLMSFFKVAGSCQLILHKSVNSLMNS